MIASDGSATADRAARKASTWRARSLASVTLVFIGHPKTGKLVMEDTIDVYGARIETEVRLLKGDPPQRILQTRRGRRRGARRRREPRPAGAKGFLLGSVPENVVEGTRRDVLVCRTVDADRVGARVPARAA